MYDHAIQINPNDEAPYYNKGRGFIIIFRYCPNIIRKI